MKGETATSIMKRALPEALAKRGADSMSGLSARLSKARHDLQNTLGQILGFSEMLLEELQEKGQTRFQTELEFINQTSPI